MQFYDVIQERTSIKQFKDTPLEQNKIARIINAAMMAPSWKNNTSYKIILVDDKQERERLANTIHNDSQDAASAVKTAPMTAVVVANPQMSGQIDGREYYLVDGAIAMEHLVLAATSEGYGTCWIAAIDEEGIRQMLNIPQDYRVVAITPIGEIAEDKAHYPKKNVQEYVFLNQWQNAYATHIQ